MSAEKDGDKKAATGGGKKKLIIMILALLLLGGGGVGGSLYFMGMLGGGSGKAAEEKEEHKEVKNIPIYFAFPKAFTVNFETDQGLRFLQVSVEIMSYDQVAIDAVGAHMPVIKNNIILLLSNQTYGDLISVEGKKEIRQRMLNEIQAILDKYKTESTVEEVYFTNFVMQ